jgi:anaerobic selenocysteine-containing dehydrogenase
MPTTRLTTCPLCEATCGLTVSLDGTSPGARVLDVRGDGEDPFSQGFACPKGLALGRLHHDPDRLRAPLVDGRETGWEQAWQAVHERLGAVLRRHGRDAIAVYLGNPNVHNLAGALYLPALVKALGGRYVFSASTSDQMPKQVAAVLMYGDPLTIAVPDVDRTDLFVVLGADPLTSNGSLMTAPDMPGRLRALRHRGGRLVVVDPRTSRTARSADLHLPIRPGTDALLLAALAHVLLQEGRAVDPGPHVRGVDELPAALAAFSPDVVAGPTGLPAAAIRDLARELAAAPSAAVYGRLGTTTTRFGTLASWLVDVVNVLTGNLDSPGGVMFPLAAAGQRNSSAATRARVPRFGRFSTVERGLPEVLGELPSAAMAEEILAGHMRAMITVAGNPALSAPDAGRLDRALAGLDVLICVDPYLNETSRHADVVLPVPGPLERPHLDLTFAQLAVRNTVRYTPAVLAPSVPAEWRTLARLTGIVAGAGPDADPQVVHAQVLSALVDQQVAAEGSPLAGRDPAEVVADLDTGGAQEQLLDLLLRVGPYRLTLDDVRRHPHGLDLGPLRPRLPEVLRTPSGCVELAPGPLLADLPRLRAALAEPLGGLLLVGRRHLRSNNSWGHNLAELVGGSNRCTLQIHPDDAVARGLADAATARVRSSAGQLDVEVEVTDRVRPGVVSLPHGWGHDVDGVGLQVARAAGGVNTNVLTPPEVDPLSGTTVLNGIPVTVAPVPAPVPDPAPAPAP